MISYQVSIYTFFLRCQRQYVYLGLVIRNAFSRNGKNFLVTMALYYLRCLRQHSYFGQIRCAPYRYLFLSKILTWPLFILEKLCGFTLNQPLTSVLWSNIKCVSEPCPNGFPYFPDASDLLFSVAMTQNDSRIMLQKILLSTQALRVLPPPTFQGYITCVPLNSNQYSNSVNI